MKIKSTTNSERLREQAGQRPAPKAFASERLNAQSSLELRIEELVLHGFAPTERYAIGEAVERELTRLIGEQGIPNLLRDERPAEEIKGATFNLAHKAGAPVVGRQIAQSVYRGLIQ